jgi:hypothetical protein
MPFFPTQEKDDEETILDLSNVKINFIAICCWNSF